MARGVVYAGLDAGYVHASDAENGELLWSSSVDSAVQSSPVVIGGNVIVGTRDGLIYALRVSE